MKQYIDMCKKALCGHTKENRTGISTVGYFGEMCQYDMADGFPAVTTKRLAFKTCISEMLCFLRGYTNAADFRNMKCKVWDAFANDNTEWLKNKSRTGEDDLGRIYGAQARNWKSVMPKIKGLYGIDNMVVVDQLHEVVRKLKLGVDDRRLIVTHWNPGELGFMALPPCHLLYQFGIHGGRLNLMMYQRSCDLPLGVPFNIAGYAWLLMVIAHITDMEPGVFTHCLADTHVYENQIDTLHIQIERKPFPLPKLNINKRIKSLWDLENWVTADDFELINYKHHEQLDYPIAVG